MHTQDNPECVFGAESLEWIDEYCYAYLGRDSYTYYFIKKVNWEFKIVTVDTLDEQEIIDMMREDFDAHDAWVQAVRDWDTDSSYNDWQENVDIWQECDPEDYYGCNEAMVGILYDLWLWYDSIYDNNNGSYLKANESKLERNSLERLAGIINMNAEFNQKLWDDIESNFGINELQFLAAEPIR